MRMNFAVIVLVLSVLVSSSCSAPSGCTAMNCPDGCCTADQVCHAPSKDFCGEAGSVCDSCSGSMVCKSGACATSATGGGTAATGGGTAVTGGGTAVTGGGTAVTGGGTTSTGGGTAVTGGGTAATGGGTAATGGGTAATGGGTAATGGGTATGTTFYIATNGNDSSGTGTASAPWRTLFKACSTVQTAGDVIHVNEGTYTETQKCLLAVGVSLEGAGVTSVLKSTLSTQFQAMVELVSPEGTNGNQQIHHLKFDGTNLTTSWGVRIGGRSNVSMHDCTVVDFLDRGVIFGGRVDGANQAPGIYATGNSFYNNTVLNSGVYDGYGRANLNIGGQDGMQIYGNTIIQNQRPIGRNGWCIKGFNDGYLKNVKIHDNTFTRIPFTVGDDWDFAVELFFLEGGNEFYNNTVQGALDTNFQRKGSSTYSLWVHDNTFSLPAPQTATQHGIILEFDSAGVIIEKNVFTNLHAAVTFYPRDQLVQDVTIRQNLMRNNGGNSSANFVGGFQSSGDAFNVKNLFILNNTMVANPAARPDWGINLGGVDAGSSYDNVQVKNNILMNTSAAWLVCGSLDRLLNSRIQFNDAFSNGNNNDPQPSFIVSPPLAPSSVISNNLKVDPGFLNTTTYELSSNSPLLNAGVDAGLPFTGSAPNIGWR